MSAFTDDDLKRLKEIVGTEQIHKGDWVNIGIGDVKALIVRLETAEVYGMKMALKHQGWFLKELYAWADAAGHRKAAGK